MYINSSALVVSVAFKILSIVSVLAVSLKIRRSSDDSFNERKPCCVALNKTSFFDSWQIIQSLKERVGEDLF